MSVGLACLKYVFICRKSTLGKILHAVYVFGKCENDRPVYARKQKITEHLPSGVRLGLSVIAAVDVAINNF